MPSPERSPTEADTVAIPKTDLTLWQAAQYAADGDTYWRQTMPAVLSAFPQVRSIEEYWHLTVAEHATLVSSIGGGGG